MNRYSYLMFVVFAVACVSGVPARADDLRLTEESVTEFIQKTSDITGGKNSAMSAREIEDYLDQHLSDDARFKSTILYTIPGYENQKSTMSVGKKEFIKAIDKIEDKTVEDYENQVVIDKISIAQGGRNATVQTRTREAAMLPVSDGIEKKEVPVEGISTCTQIIILSKNDVIQMFNATCVTDIKFETFTP